MIHQAEKNSVYLKQYFTSIEIMLEYIDKYESLIKVSIYKNILKLKLSKYELLLILNFSILPQNSNFFKLINKYDILSEIESKEVENYDDFDRWDCYDSLRKEYHKSNVC